jgi:hypothetical protein
MRSVPDAPACAADPSDSLALVLAARCQLEHDEIILINNWVIDDRWLMPETLKPPYEVP